LNFTWFLLLVSLVPVDIGLPSWWIVPGLSVIDYLCAFLLLVWFISVLQKREWNKWFDLVGWQALFLWSCFLVFGATDAVSKGGSVRELLRWGEFLFCFVLALQIRTTVSNSPAVLARLLSWTGALLGAMAISQFIRSHGDYTSTFATIKQHNGFSGYLSLCIPSAWATAIASRRRQRILYTALSLVQSAAFVMAYSRGAWMGLVAATGIIFCLKALRLTPTSYQRYGSIGLTFFLLTAAAAPLFVISRRPEMGNLTHFTLDRPKVSDQSHPSTRGGFDISERPLYWGAAYRIFISHPWCGLGPGNYVALLPSYLDANGLKLWTYELNAKHRVEFWMHLHSMYLQILVEYGMIGFLLWSFAMTALVAPSLSALSQHGTGSVLPMAFLISALAFLIHNTVDILFVNSFDLLFVILVVLSRPTPESFS
jgi:O-antigen ligase